MSWTVIDDDDIIQVRASINTKTEENELRDLIRALVIRYGDPVYKSIFDLKPPEETKQ